MSESKHTPFRLADDEGLVAGYDETGGPSFDIFDASEWPGTEIEGKAIAERLTLTWNCHDDLLGGLKALLGDAESLVKTAGYEPTSVVAARSLIARITEATS